LAAEVDCRFDIADFVVMPRFASRLENDEIPVDSVGDVRHLFAERSHQIREPQPAS
jgi:hypothetical protein